MKNEKWKTMIKEEKITRILAMKNEGYSNREIGIFYGVSEDAIKKTLQRSEMSLFGTKRTLDEIHNTPVKMSENMAISIEMFSSLCSKIEQLELEVASVKKLKVESASIELLNETEYKYFVMDKITGKLLKKFTSDEDCLNYLSELSNHKLFSGYLKESFKDKYEFHFKCKYLVRKSLDKEFENVKFTTNSLKDDFKDIYTKLEEIKNNQNL